MYCTTIFPWVLVYEVMHTISSRTVLMTVVEVRPRPVSATLAFLRSRSTSPKSRRSRQESCPIRICREAVDTDSDACRVCRVPTTADLSEGFRP